MTIGTIQATTFTTRAMDQVRAITSSSTTTGATKIINTIINRTTTSKTATTSNSNTTTNISSHTIKITILMIRRTMVRNNTIRAWVILLMARVIAVLVAGNSLIIKVTMMIEVNGTRINNSTAEARKTRINNLITEDLQIKTSNSVIEVLRIRISMRREILASWEALWTSLTQTSSPAEEAWNNPLHRVSMPRVRDSLARGSIKDLHLAINKIKITTRTLIRGNHIVGQEDPVACQEWVVLNRLMALQGLVIQGWLKISSKEQIRNNHLPQKYSHKIHLRLLNNSHGKKRRRQCHQKIVKLKRYHQNWIVSVILRSIETSRSSSKWNKASKN